MSFHIDIDQINQKKMLAKQDTGKGGLLVNRGDLLTKEEKLTLQRENKRIYELP